MVAESTTEVCPSSSTPTTTSTTTTISPSLTTTQTTTSGTLPSTPVSKGCRTVGGPGATKRCKPFGYGHKVESYDGCINRKTPDQRLTSMEFTNQDQSSKRPRKVSTLFWCATEVGPTGSVTEWARCAQNCKVAGTFLPKSPK